MLCDVRFRVTSNAGSCRPGSQACAWTNRLHLCTLLCHLWVLIWTLGYPKQKVSLVVGSTSLIDLTANPTPDRATFREGGFISEKEWKWKTHVEMTHSKLLKSSDFFFFVKESVNKLQKEYWETRTGSVLAIQTAIKNWCCASSLSTASFILLLKQTTLLMAKIQGGKKKKPTAFFFPDFVCWMNEEFRNRNSNLLKFHITQLFWRKLWGFFVISSCCFGGFFCLIYLLCACVGVSIY